MREKYTTSNQIFIVRGILNLLEEINLKKRIFPENTEEGGKRNLLFYLRYRRFFQIAFSIFFFFFLEMQYNGSFENTQLRISFRASFYLKFNAKQTVAD